jgi:hypothetical protein
VATWVSVERSRGEGSVEAQSSIYRACGLEVSGDPVFALVDLTVGYGRIATTGGSKFVLID